jgi:uncharacterized protein YjiS (DUF1127 family)
MFTTAIRGARVPTALLARIDAWLRRAARLHRRARAEAAARRAAAHLAELDDHLLRDIGIDRMTIDYAVRAGRRLDPRRTDDHA